MVNSSGVSVDKKISMAVIQRLPRYYRYLGDLLDRDITRISSKELSERMGITASQMRQDLNNFGSFGQQGYGYSVELLYGEIKRILGLDRTYHLIIIGAGNFGQTLANYRNFAERGYVFRAMFDTNPAVIGTYVNGIEVRGIVHLESYLANNLVDVAALTLPADAVASVVQTLSDGGVKGIWNFSNSEIKAPPNVVLENVRLMDSLMTLTYRVNQEDIVCRLKAAEGYD